MLTYHGQVGGRRQLAEEALFPVLMPTGPLSSCSSINLIATQQSGELEFPPFVPRPWPCLYLFKAKAMQAGIPLSL